MPHKSALVVFNPHSGDAASSEAQLAEITTAVEQLGLEYSVVNLTPELPCPDLARDAAKRGVGYVIASGGDNTMDMIARGLVGTHTRLVLVPTGTRNNIARALNIPHEISDAVKLIATGERVQVDMGRVRSENQDIHFLELLSIGLGGAMFPALDEAQKGNVARIGDLLATFITHAPSKFSLNLDRGKQKLDLEALTITILNMPYLGANFQLSKQVDYQDGLLDMFVYSDIGKLDFLTYALQIAQGATDDPRIRHLRLKELVIDTDPPLPVLIDGEVLEGHHFTISRVRHALNIMAPPLITAA